MGRKARRHDIDYLPLQFYGTEQSSGESKSRRTEKAKGIQAARDLIHLKGHHLLMVEVDV